MDLRVKDVNSYVNKIKDQVHKLKHSEIEFEAFGLA